MISPYSASETAFFYLKHYDLLGEPEKDAKINIDAGMFFCLGWNLRHLLANRLLSLEAHRVLMSNLTPVSSGNLVANSQGQLFLQADPYWGAAAIDVTAFMKQLAEECGKAAKAAHQDEMLTSEQAAKLLNCSVATIHRYTANGAIPSVKIGHSRRYLRSKLLALPETNSGSQELAVM